MGFSANVIFYNSSLSMYKRREKLKKKMKAFALRSGGRQDVHSCQIYFNTLIEVLAQATE